MRVCVNKEMSLSERKTGSLKGIHLKKLYQEAQQLLRVPALCSANSGAWDKTHNSNLTRRSRYLMHPRESDTDA